MTKRLAVLQQEAILRKQTFFDPTYDSVFKKIFEKKSTLIHFLNAILHLEKEREIQHIETLKRTIKLTNSQKDDEIVRFDIHAQTADGQFVDIEMQRADDDDFLDRIELYSTLLSINAKIIMDSKASQEAHEDHPYLMPMVYSIWLCNFEVDFCKSYREEFGIFRISDLGDERANPIYTKKNYIIVDITKFTPGEGNTQEQQWLELFKLMANAKRIPANIDKVLKDVYNRLLVGKSPKRFIAKVAKDMIDKKEFKSCLSTARRKGITEGEENERKRNEIAGAARDKKIAEYLHSIGVSAEAVDTALAIK